MLFRSVCVVEADGTLVWEGKVSSEPVPLLKAFWRWRRKIKLIGIEACPLPEWLYGLWLRASLKRSASRDAAHSAVPLLSTQQN